MVPIRVTDTRNVFLLKSRHSMLSTIRYDAAAGHVLLVEYYLFCAAFNDSGLLLLYCTGVVRFFFGPNKHLLYVQVLMLISLWIIIIFGFIFGWQHPTDQNTHLIVQEIHSCILLAFFFSLPSSCISCAWLCQARCLSKLISGVILHALLSLPHYRACLRRFSREKKKVQN